MPGIDATLKNHRAFLKALGGPEAVADLLSRVCGTTITKQHVIVMRQRRVPWQYRAALAAKAEQDDVAVPRGFLGYDPRRL